MRFDNIAICLSEWILIGIMSLCGVLALISSDLFIWIQPQINTHHPTLGYSLPYLIWSMIFLIGFLTIIIGRRGSGTFTGLVIVISIPSIMSFNTLDLVRIFGVQSDIKTGLDYWQMLVLGLFTITGYGLINSMSILKQSRISLINREADPEDVESVNTKSHLVLLIMTGLSLLVAVIIGSISQWVGSLVSKNISQIPWYAISIGLGCVLVLAGYLYWIGTHSKPQSE